MGCAVSGMILPCSKCGAPENWRTQLGEKDLVAERMLNAFDYLRTLPATCPIKTELLAILNGTKP